MKYLIIVILFTSCKSHMTPEQRLAADKSACTPISYEYDEYGLKNKWKQRWNEFHETCYKEKINLTRFESGIRDRAKKNISCNPQADLPKSLSLKAHQNYYNYRDDKLWLHLNSDTGEYKRIFIGKDEHDQDVYGLEVGCFFTREDKEIEPLGDKEYGLQIYLDQKKSASSNLTRNNEVYRVYQDGNQWSFVSFDQVDNWSYMFCPHFETPWGFCDLLRRMKTSNYYLDQRIKDSIKDEAILIRTHLDFIEVSADEFEDKWRKVQLNAELPQLAYKYRLTFCCDSPESIEHQWISYIKNERPFMPEVNALKKLDY